MEIVIIIISCLLLSLFKDIIIKFSPKLINFNIII
jgi:hypothetical protein